MAYFPEKVTLNPSTPASDVHTFNGNIVFGTTGITSFSSATSRYFGNKSAALTMSLGSTSSGGGFNLYINSYFDGTDNRFTIANETAGRITTAGQTSAASGFYYLQANNSVSHAADATLSFTTVHSVDSNGLHTIGTSSSNDSLVHQLYGSLNLIGAVIPSFSSTRYRYIGNKLSSTLYDNGSGSAAGGTVMYGNVYFDGTGTKRSRANETCSSVSVGGATSASTVVFAVSADNSIVSAADSAVTLTSLLTVDSNGAHVIGNSSSNNSQIQQIYGSVNLNGTAIPSFSSSTIRYVGNKISSVQFLTGAASTTGTLSAYGNMYFDGTNNKFTIANETCAKLTVGGGTAATSNVYVLAADSSVSHAADANATLVTLHSIDANGLHSIGNNASNDSLVHNINGSLLISGNSIPSFSSTNYRYIGTKMSSALLFKTTSSAGIYITYANSYFDGTNNKLTRANETGTRININGTTSASSVSCSIESDASVSHTADSTATFVQTFGITPQGQMTLGVSTQPVDYTHRIYNGVGIDITSSGTRCAIFRNNTTGNTASLIIGNAQTGNGNLRWLDFAYNGSSSSSAGTVEGYLGTDGAGVMALFDISDARKKKNLRPFKNAIEELKKAPIYIFDRIDTDQKDIVGFIAQDVEKIDPRFVTEHDEIKRVGKDSLVHYMHAAILELSERLEKIEGKKKTKKDEE